MTEENKIILLKRLRSFSWRAGAVLAVAALNFIAVNLSLFDLSPLIITISGLVIAEITKELNKVVSK